MYKFLYYKSGFLVLRSLSEVSFQGFWAFSGMEFRHSSIYAYMNLWNKLFYGGVGAGASPGPGNVGLRVGLRAEYLIVSLF